jgi:hypothetical protein
MRVTETHQRFEAPSCSRALVSGFVAFEGTAAADVDGSFPVL